MTSSGSLDGKPTYATHGSIFGRGNVNILFNDTNIGINIVEPQPIAGETRSFTLKVVLQDGGAECTATGEVRVR